MNKLLIGYLFLFLSVVLITLLAFDSSYFPHLQVDIVVFYNRANFFLQNLSLEHLANNEYQPGALLFFILLSPILSINNSFDTFKLAFFAANILLLFLASIIPAKTVGWMGIAVFGLILLFTGPIILFRFDLLAALVVNLSFYFWLKDKKILSFVILSIATQIKVYPIIFLPYLLFLSFKNKGIKVAFGHLLCFLGSLIIFLSLFILIFDARLADIINALDFHAKKPLGIESVYATVLLLLNTPHLPQPVGAYGIWGFSPKDIVLPLQVYNYLWLIPFIILHIVLFFQARRPNFDLRFCLVNILSFLIFSKVFAHQYLIWFLLIIPLFFKNHLKKTIWKINLLLILLTSLLSQFIYPLNYTEFLEELMGKNNFSFVFYASIVRNILLVVLLVSLIFDWLKSSDKSTLVKTTSIS